VCDQIRQGIRKGAAEGEPLTPEAQARVTGLVDEAVAAGERGELDRARAKLEEAVRLDPEGVEALFNLGVVYGLIAHREISKGEFYDNYVRDEVFVEKAKICYDRVLELDARHLPSLKNLATLYAMRDERDLAMDYLRRIIGAEAQDDGDRALVAQARQQLSELESI
jgi:tetratricopeptide (TPR) repeat protein